MPAHLTTYMIMLPLFAWMVWRRISRTFGRQPIQPKRMILRIVAFAVLGLLLAFIGLHQIELAEGLLGGVTLGAALGVLGVRLTRFEIDPDRGDCYVPNQWIGAVLTVLLLGRLAWRFLVVLPQAQVAAQVAPAAGAPVLTSFTPMTMLMIGLLVGYYIVYFTGLLFHQRRFQQQPGSPTV